MTPTPPPIPELAPCPLCGCTELETSPWPANRARTEWVARCGHPDCGCEVRALTLADCTRRWNRRPPAPRVPMLWEHKHDKPPIGYLEMDPRGRLIVTFADAIVRDVFFHMFPGASARIIEHYEGSGLIWVRRAEIIEYSLLPLGTVSAWDVAAILSRPPAAGMNCEEPQT